MLGEKKLKAIESIIKGENISDTAKISGVIRQSIYTWM